MRVLVTGATGFVGRKLVDAMLMADHEVIVLTRDRARYNGPDDVQVVEGDVLETWSFDDTLDIDCAYYLIHSMGAGATMPNAIAEQPATLPRLQATLESIASSISADSGSTVTSFRHTFVPDGKSNTSLPAASTN